jgi:hypothetical protein
MRCVDLSDADSAELEWIDASAVPPDEPYEGEDGDAAAAGPCPRMHHSATVIGGDVYVFGGVRIGAAGGSAGVEEETLGDLWIYDVEEEEWRMAGDGGGDGGDSGRGGGGGGRGGWRGEEDGAAPLPPADAPPAARYQHAAAAAADRFLLVWGGATGRAHK